MSNATIYLPHSNVRPLQVHRCARSAARMSSWDTRMISNFPYNLFTT